MFEATIRCLGGLLSIFDLTGDEMFLDRAQELGTGLLKAFDTPSGIPWPLVNLKTFETLFLLIHQPINRSKKERKPKC